MTRHVHSSLRPKRTQAHTVSSLSHRYIHTGTGTDTDTGYGSQSSRIFMTSPTQYTIFNIDCKEKLCISRRMKCFTLFPPVYSFSSSIFWLVANTTKAADKSILMFHGHGFLHPQCLRIVNENYLPVVIIILRTGGNIKAQRQTVSDNELMCNGRLTLPHKRWWMVFLIKLILPRLGHHGHNRDAKAKAKKKKLAMNLKNDRLFDKENSPWKMASHFHWQTISWKTQPFIFSTRHFSMN